MKIEINLYDETGEMILQPTDLAENEMSLPAFKKILQAKKMKDMYAHVTPRKRGQGSFPVDNNNVPDPRRKELVLSEKMSTGGRAGYAAGSIEPDLDADELNELTSWWKSEVNKSFDS